MTPTCYPVYKVKSFMALPDPHMPPGRFHHTIFVETSQDGSGSRYHVTGDVTSPNGMIYESRESPDPAQLEAFHCKECLGYTTSDVHPEQWNSLLASLPTPPQQKASNPKNQGRVEPFKEKIHDYEYVFYNPGEERESLWKCTEWVEWYALPALQERGFIQDGVISILALARQCGLYAKGKGLYHIVAIDKNEIPFFVAYRSASLQKMSRFWSYFLAFSLDAINSIKDEVSTALEQGIDLDWEDVYDVINPFGDRRGRAFNSVWTFDLNKDLLFLTKDNEIFSAPLRLATERLLTLDDFEPVNSPNYTRAEDQAVPEPY
ncbi:hypothetical protein FBEOM_9376 [Fusarium beomiforme]|uniref:Uncharacterized protein n=1 Tax=Fusarium beomiforme TaxID=44412 RepID=A0A9P5DV98_9HYPO|nr:hypothetical protein FBEOM_9376 [Fusarium beomiforme]